MSKIIAVVFGLLLSASTASAAFSIQRPQRPVVVFPEITRPSRPVISLPVFPEIPRPERPAFPVL